MNLNYILDQLIIPSGRGDDEKNLEVDVKVTYDKYQSISLNFSKGYKFNTYYLLKAIITDLTTNISTNDGLVFMFQKPPVACVVDSVGGIVSIVKDVTLNGNNSVIPEAAGDTVQYLWGCEKAFSFVDTMTCTCPTQTASALSGNQLTIPKNKLQDLCKYTYSLTVSAISSSGRKRTAYNQTEFLAFRQPISPVYWKNFTRISNYSERLLFHFPINKQLS